jgi:penicillin-binding protein 1A
MKSFLVRIWSAALRAYGWVQPYLHRLRTIAQAWLNRVDTYFEKHPRRRKWAIRLGLVFGPPFSVFLILLLVVWLETPGKRALRNVQNQVASEVYSADSVLLGRYFIQDRTEIRYEEIAPVVVDALIATEDVRFYEHRGVDYRSLGRVLVKSVVMGEESSGGGSTLTQQLAKNLYPRKKYWFFSMLLNKLREVRTALRLERLYSKKELIAMYLNTVPFADNVYGIQAAAQRFYSVTAAELSLEQAAVLVGMLKATHSYNPRLFPDRARARRNVVLSQMVKYELLSKTQADSIKTLPVVLQYNQVSHHHGLAPYFREFLKTELLEWCEENDYNLYTDGLKIYTTIDSRLQRHAERAVEEQMKQVQRMFYDHWGREKPWRGKEYVLDEAIERSSRYIALQKQGLTADEILRELQKPIPMRKFTWQGEEEVVMSPIDSIAHHLQFLNAGFLAMEQATGEIKAWVGGIEHDFFQYDHVKTSTKRQVGSIFKPIVYAAVLEQGADPCEHIPASQQTYIVDDTVEWTPRNTQNDYRVQYTMPGALAYSVNTVAAKMIQRAGVDNTRQLAAQMGITSEIPDVPSISLGASSVSLLEMTSAYACLANEGITVTPRYVSTILNLDGESVGPEKKTEAKQRVISEQTGTLVRHMLQTVVYEGTASRLRWRYGVYQEVAGKTGTTQSNADGWFMAFTPNLVMGAWVGADDPRIRFRYTSLGQGSSTALPITAYFLKYVNQDNAFREISTATFPRLKPEWMQKLNCDLYELNDELIADIQQTTHVRDSLTLFKQQLMLTDSLAADSIKVPDESFLEQLYRRKLKIQARQQADSSAVQAAEFEGG